MSDRFAHDMPFGAAVLPECGVRFQLWAPNQQTVRLVLGDRDAAVPMERGENGWFRHSDAKASVDMTYCFELAGGERVPDPASRAQPHGVHGLSKVVAPLAYRWKHPEWRGRPWRETVLYEAHLGCFTQEDGFDGARRKLDHLASLGVTALELMPVAEFDGTRNWGYDGVLLFAPHRCYGTPEDLKRLVDEAHERNLMMVLDVVYNHFGPSGNYLRLYAPAFFLEDRRTPWGAAIDFGGPQSRPVRDFFIHNALYWLEEFRFDGLRLDAAHAIADPSSPDILTELADSVRARLEPERHVHLILENDANSSGRLRRNGGTRTSHYDAQWNDDVHHAAHVLLTGEDHGYYADYVDDPTTKLARALAEGFAFQGEQSRYRNNAPRGESSIELPAVAFVDFSQDHDQIGNRAFGERLTTLVPENAIAALAALLLLSPHIPMLFMGEEWSTRVPFHFFCDFKDDLAKAVREGRRRELARALGGDAAATLDRIPDPNSPSTFERSCLNWDEVACDAARQRLERVKSLLALRQREIVPRLENIAGRGAGFEVADQGAFRVSWRLGDGALLSVAANLSGQPVAGLKWEANGRIICTEPPDFAVAPILRALPPWSVIWSLSVWSDDH